MPKKDNQLRHSEDFIHRGKSDRKIAEFINIYFTTVSNQSSNYLMYETMKTF